MLLHIVSKCECERDWLFVPAVRVCQTAASGSAGGEESERNSELVQENLSVGTLASQGHSLQEVTQHSPSLSICDTECDIRNLSRKVSFFFWEI